MGRHPGADLRSRGCTRRTPAGPAGHHLRHARLPPVRLHRAGHRKPDPGARARVPARGRHRLPVPLRVARRPHQPGHHSAVAGGDTARAALAGHHHQHDDPGGPRHRARGGGRRRHHRRGEHRPAAAGGTGPWRHPADRRGDPRGIPRGPLADHLRHAHHRRGVRARAPPRRPDGGLLPAPGAVVHARHRRVAAGRPDPDSRPGATSPAWQGTAAQQLTARAMAAPPLHEPAQRDHRAPAGRLRDLRRRRRSAGCSSPRSSGSRCSPPSRSGICSCTGSHCPGRRTRRWCAPPRRSAPTSRPFPACAASVPTSARPCSAKRSPA